VSAKQAINDKLQGSVATYLRCGGVVKSDFLKSVNIWQSYKQDRGSLMHFALLANTLLKDEESAPDNHVFVFLQSTNV